MRIVRPDPALDAIPESQRTAVAAALTAAFGAASLQALEVLRGGLSPALVYRITVADRRYVLRAVTRRSELNDPARHHACLRAAAEAGLAPRVHYTGDADAITIIEYVDAQPFTRCPRPQLLDGLAALVARLQATQTFPAMPAFAGGRARGLNVRANVAR